MKVFWKILKEVDMKRGGEGKKGVGVKILGGVRGGGVVGWEVGDGLDEEECGELYGEGLRGGGDG